MLGVLGPTAAAVASAAAATAPLGNQACQDAAQPTPLPFLLVGIVFQMYIRLVGVRKAKASVRVNAVASGAQKV